uniref:Atlastin n=1 Tax=Lygus hesperus TaxID=30085 RepID=A0A0A9VQD1_LYGHE
MELVTVSSALYSGGVQYKLNNEGVKKLMENPEVKNMKIAVISVFGKGGSVIYDLLLKYAIHRYKEGKNPSENWLTSASSEHRRSSIQSSRAIMIWRELFIAKTKTNENIAVLLMVSQGILAAQEEASTFALSVLASSTQLFHVMRRISEEQMKQIEMFTEFSKHLQEIKGANKAFQHLLFVVRGWDEPTQYEFRFRGGNQYLIESIFNDAKFAPERIKTRRNVMSSFDKIYVFSHG